MAAFGPVLPIGVVELDLVRFYGNLVFEDLQWVSWTSNIQFLERVKDAYCKRSIQDRLSDITFDHPGMRCAYIFINTPCFSGAVAFHFYALLHQNPWLFQRALYHGALSVCCLGGGPAPELLAILKVLEFLLRFYRLPKVVVRATVVDIDDGWKSTAKWITQNWWKYFDHSSVQLQLTFVQADLTDPADDAVKKAVGNADVVTMVKFLSAVFGTSKRERIPSMFQEITDCLPVGSVLFFMNSARFGCLQDCDAIASGNYMTTIYSCDYVHHLSNRARVECIRLYFEYYGWTAPTLEHKSKVIAWYKRKQRR